MVQKNVAEGQENIHIYKCEQSQADPAPMHNNLSETWGDQSFANKRK